LQQGRPSGNPLAVGLFDIFKSSGTTAVQKLAPKVADKRGLAPDRWEAIQALAKFDSEEAVEALLVRFTFYTDPTITDQEEKDFVFQTVASKGAVAAAPLKRFLKRAESAIWPLKMLDRVLPAEEMLDVLKGLLAEMDTEYERDPQRKLQVLSDLEGRTGAGIIEVVKPFLRDVNESARFYAIGAVLAQDDRESARSDLLEVLASEESMRNKARLLDGFAKYGWPVDIGRVGRLPDAFGLDAQGIPRRRA
jgi:hypothetical protein